MIRTTEALRRALIEFGDMVPEDVARAAQALIDHHDSSVKCARAEGFAAAREMAAHVIELSGAECSGASKRRLAQHIRAMQDGRAGEEGPPFCGWCHHARHDGHACRATYGGAASGDVQCRCVGGQRP